MEILVKVILLLGLGINAFLLVKNLSKWHMARLPKIILNISFMMGCIMMFFTKDPGWSLIFFFASFIILAPMGFLLEKRYGIAAK